MATSNVSPSAQTVANPNENIVMSHKQLAELLVKHHAIHEGIWGLFLRFGIGAANLNVGPVQPGSLNPAAIIPVLEIGLQRFQTENDISVDAAKVNPKKSGKPAHKTPSR